MSAEGTAPIETGTTDTAPGETFDATDFLRALSPRPLLLHGVGGTSR